MIDLNMKCGGYVTSIRNPDGTELLKRPVKNKWLDWGMVLIANGGGISNTGTLLFDLDERNQFFGQYALFYSANVHLGTGASASTLAMTALEKEITSSATMDSIKQNIFEIVNGKLHVRLTFTFNSSYTFREFGLSRGYYGWGDTPDSRINNLLFRVVLDEPIQILPGSAIDYDFYMTLPYPTRTVVDDLFGTGIPGEIWLRAAYGGTSNNLMRSCVGGIITENKACYNTASPLGLMSHGYISSSTNIFEKPMFSSDTTKDFPADGVGDVALPITCASASYEWVSCDQANYTATMKYVIPASLGALSIAYGNIRGLAFRFGSYDAQGKWVGQTYTKDLAHKLNITMKYSFESM